MKGLRHRPVFTTVTAASLSQRTVMRSPVQRAPHNFKATTIVNSSKELISRFCSEIKGGKNPMEILVITHTAAASKTRIGRKHLIRRSPLGNVNHRYAVILPQEAAPPY